MKNSLYIIFISSIVTSCYILCSTFNFVSNKTERGHLDPQFIQQLVEEFKPDIFFETGTYDGGTTTVAASFFKQVYTVELSEELYKTAAHSLTLLPNVSMYCDSSPAMIKKVVPTFDGRILFWLDAHFSGGNTVRSNDDTSDPDAYTAIRKELAAIKECNIQNCTILLDDIRGFGSVIDGIEYLGCWAYPSIQEVCRLGREINPNFSFALLGDMLLMYDTTQFRPSFSPVVEACTATRLYDGTDLTDEQLVAYEKVIMHAQGVEREFITTLYRWMTDWKDALFIHDLWYGLINMGSGDWTEALVALHKVPTRVEVLNKQQQCTNTCLSYDHWRINHYIACAMNTAFIH
jgi:hypothetical protein